MWNSGVCWAQYACRDIWLKMVQRKKSIGYIWVLSAFVRTLYAACNLEHWILFIAEHPIYVWTDPNVTHDIEAVSICSVFFVGFGLFLSNGLLSCIHVKHNATHRIWSNDSNGKIKMLFKRDMKHALHRIACAVMCVSVVFGGGNEISMTIYVTMAICIKELI